MPRTRRTPVVTVVAWTACLTLAIVRIMGLAALVMYAIVVAVIAAPRLIREARAEEARLARVNGSRTATSTETLFTGTVWGAPNRPTVFVNGKRDEAGTRAARAERN